MARLVFHDRPPKIAHNAFNYTLDFKREIKVINAFKRKAGDPSSKLF